MYVEADAAHVALVAALTVIALGAFAWLFRRR